MSYSAKPAIVERPRAPWSAAVHDVLAWLAFHAPGRAPEPVALDGDTWTVSYVPGDVYGVPFRGPLLEARSLASVGRLLRAIHDATSAYKPPSGALWMAGPAAKRPGEVIRHGDVGAGNVVWRGGEAVALIDWEFAEPGPAIDDLALAAWTLVPLAPPERRAAAGLPAGAEPADRLEALCAGYGSYRVRETLAAFRALVEREIARRRALGGQGVEPWARLLRSGQVERMEATAAWFDTSPLADQQAR